MRNSLKEKGQPLVIRTGNVIEIFEEISSKFNIMGIYSHQETGDWLTYKRDQEVKLWAANKKIIWKEYLQFSVFRGNINRDDWSKTVSYTHLRAHETDSYLVCRLLLEKKYLSNKKQLEKTDKKKFDELIRRFYLKNWRIILLMCNYQTKYRYYSKVIISIKDKSFPEMKNKDFLKLFENN